MVEVTHSGFGWCRVAGDRGLDAAVRFAESRSGRFVAREVAMAAEGGLSGGDLCRVPLARIESWANAHGAHTVRAGVASRVLLSDAERDTVDDRERAGPAMRAEWGTTSEAAAGQASMLALTGGPELVVVEPAVRPRPDEFYQRVADAYGLAAAGSHKPAVVVAEASGVDVERIHRWIKEARRRGLIPPARRGAA